MELDVVASSPTEAFASNILLDAKKSSAGFSDIFKIYGWRVFLKIPKGCIVHGVPAESPAQGAFQNVCPKLNVFAEYFDIGKDANMASVSVLNVGAEDKLRHIARLTGWYQLIAERLCVRDFQDVRKKHQVRKSSRESKNTAVVVILPFSRATRSSERSFSNKPSRMIHLSDSAVEWQAKQKVQKPELVWKAVRDSAEYPWLQHVLSLETKARILIIKNGLEAALADATNEKMEKF